LNSTSSPSDTSVSKIACTSAAVASDSRLGNMPKLRAVGRQRLDKIAPSLPLLTAYAAPIDGAVRYPSDHLGPSRHAIAVVPLSRPIRPTAVVLVESGPVLATPIEQRLADLQQEFIGQPQTKRIGEAFLRLPSSPLYSSRFGGSRSWNRTSRRRFGGSPAMASQATGRNFFQPLTSRISRREPVFRGGSNG
jgi:hypothetical protein